ncbi:MAG TPA: efflux RND transporter periplasmic adaptor subunit [Ktedonobacteraceae bacterium]|nr:efflux RND transporter periplasmic adaptor subunit [Ktedonobacteraceae bacterium]
MRRMILVPALVVLAMLAIAGGIAYYLYSNYISYRTDDAQVTGTILSISAPTSGQISSLTVKQGDKVAAGQTIATITSAPVTGTRVAPATINVTSPTNGTILQVPAIQGQGVVPGLTIVQLTNLDAVTITAFVDENAINTIKLGQDVDIHVDAYSDTTFTGKVQQIVQATAGSFSLLPTQDNASGNFTKVGQRIPVVITFVGDTGRTLMPGMSAEVTIHIH